MGCNDSPTLPDRSLPVTQSSEYTTPAVLLPTIFIIHPLNRLYPANVSPTHFRHVAVTLMHKPTHTETASPMLIQNTILPTQGQQHLEIPFDVPSGVNQLIIDLAYAPQKTDGYNNLLTLTLFDPNGIRGEGHRHAPRQRVAISAADATPGYLPGDLPVGRWMIVINTHLVLEPITYSMHITFDDQPLIGAHARVPTPGKTAPRGLGWYRGDLHAHTLHSDAHWDVPDLVAYARAERLDFVTLSDHNTISGLAQMDSLSSDNLLTMGGMELTTYHGHALALGTRRHFDWRIRPGEWEMTNMLREITAAGGTFIIAHPMAAGNPVCTGCDWQYADVMPGAARLVEIWNGDWREPFDQNEKGLRLWYRWLNEGCPIFATAGSDIHGTPEQPTTYGRNVVYAETLSEAAILDAVRRGRLYLSQGPRLELTGSTPDGQQAMMGDTLVGDAATLTAAWSDAPAGCTLRWIVDGEPRQTVLCEASGTAQLALADARWCVLELRDSGGQMQAITNPIFIQRR